jgi:hypothetical protein
MGRERMGYGEREVEVVVVVEVDVDQALSVRKWCRRGVRTSHPYSKPNNPLLPTPPDTPNHPLITPTPGCPRPMLTSKYTLEGVTNRPAVEAVLELIRLSKPFPETKLPGSVVRQREIVAELEEEFQQSAVNQVTMTAVCLCDSLMDCV